GYAGSGGGFGGSGVAINCYNFPGFTSECGINSFCDFSAPTCGLAQGSFAAGICQPRPQLCPLDCPGVCGCNGQFYCNACLAHVAGTDDSSDRSCLANRPDAAVTICGGLTGAT